MAKPINNDDYIGYHEFKQDVSFEDGVMVISCYFTCYDRDGNEVSREDCTDPLKIRWGDGHPFTLEDYEKIKR